MSAVDPTFPVFVLIGLLVGETYYAKTLVPRVKALKQRHLDNPDAILHSRDIRRLEGDFLCLRESEKRKQEFYSDLNDFFQSMRFRLFAIAIDKRKLLNRPAKSL